MFFIDSPLNLFLNPVTAFFQPEVSLTAL